MNLKTFTTSVATAALVGALGLAYAQTYSDPAPAAPAAPTADRMTPSPTPAPATTPSSTAPSESATTSSPSPGTEPSSGTMAEPTPRADRG